MKKKPELLLEPQPISLVKSFNNDNNSAASFKLKALESEHKI